MAKRSSSSTGRSILGAIIGTILFIGLLIFQSITGINLLGSTTPTAPGVAQATSAPATARPTLAATSVTRVTAAPATAVASAPSGAVTMLTVPTGFGAQKGFWTVYFNAPTGNSNRATYTASIDTQLAAAIDGARSTLDIAAFEYNNRILTDALLRAHARGVRVRMVADNEHGTEDEDSTYHELVTAGIQVVDDGRSALMHNKFTIIDSSVVWTGSWNYTVNDTYRNNNNAIVLRSRQAVENYQREFDEMFTRKQFGPRSTSDTPNPTFTQDGTPIEVYFAAEDSVVEAIVRHISEADRSVRFMAFSFTLAPIGIVLQERAEAGVNVQGIFETTGSETRFSQLTPLFCAGLPMRQDGNRYILHHKVFIIDDETVLTGSFNFSASATDSNDENLLIIRDRDLAAQYIAEFERRWAEARVPDGLTC